MPAYLPIPEGFTPPEEPQFELPVMFEMRDGQLYALAIDGMPLPEAEGEMEDEEMEDEGEGNMDFMAAVERGMAQR